MCCVVKATIAMHAIYAQVQIMVTNNNDYDVHILHKINNYIYYSLFMYKGTQYFYILINKHAAFLENILHIIILSK